MSGQRKEEHKEFLRREGESHFCIHCHKEYLYDVMEKDYILDGWTCRKCVQGIEKFPELTEYIIRLEQVRDDLQRDACLAVTFAEKVAGHTQDGDVIRDIASLEHSIKTICQYNLDIKKPI